jgi:hypothetical protein
MDDVRRVALAALTSALDDGKQEARSKPGLTGVRAVAAGAVLYTAGKAAISGRRFLQDHTDGSDADAEEEDFDEDEEEPEAELDEDFDEEDEEEPEAGAEEYFDEDDAEPASRRPPVHHDPDDEAAEADLPERPSRRRKPVGRR